VMEEESEEQWAGVKAMGSEEESDEQWVGV
jgi:hypothetical protein